MSSKENFSGTLQKYLPKRYPANKTFVIDSKGILCTKL